MNTTQRMEIGAIKDTRGKQIKDTVCTQRIKNYFVEKILQTIHSQNISYMDQKLLRMQYMDITYLNDRLFLISSASTAHNNVCC